MAAVRIANLRLTRRQVIQSALVASSAWVVPRWSWAGSEPTVSGFLGTDELAVLDALTTRILPTGDSVGAREAGVIDYIQGLLSALPALDPNADGRRGAADLTAVAVAVETGAPAGDADQDGQITDNDVRVITSAIFDGTPSDAIWPARQAIHAGGPYSGRTPFGDPATGTPSTNFPPNAFLESVPLPRVKRLAWTVRLLGADAVPEVADNPLARSQTDVDMRRRYRDGLQLLSAEALEQFGQPFPELTGEQQDAVVATVRTQPGGAVFINLVSGHTVEGFLCAPEYGGNRDRVGWQLIGFDGDSQPLGYTIFDETTQMYRERPDKPNSGPNPGDPCSDFSEEMLRFLRFIFVQLTAGGMEYPNPTCFEVT